MRDHQLVDAVRAYARDQYDRGGESVRPAALYFRGERLVVAVEHGGWADGYEKHEAIMAMLSLETIVRADSMVIVLDVYLSIVGPDDEQRKTVMLSGELMPRDDPQAVEALILIEVKDGVIDGLRSMPYHHGPGGVRFDEPKTEDPSGSKTWIGDVAELAHAARDDLADISLDEAVAGLGRMGFHSFLRWDPPA